MAHKSAQLQEESSLMEDGTLDMILHVEKCGQLSCSGGLAALSVCVNVSTVGVQGPRDHAAAAAELLFDSVSSPAIMDHILEVQKEKISAANDTLVRDPAFMASEGVVSVAYTGALARPSFWQGEPMSADNLLAYHGAVCTHELLLLQSCLPF